jgi:CRP/FNR family nitrogen fixation transcriptional regulator
LAVGIEAEPILGPDGQVSREDIADYLGLTVETVSRSFTKLERAGMIARKGNRRIVLRNRAALQHVIG